MINEDRRANIATGILLALIKSRPSLYPITNKDEVDVIVQHSVDLTDALIKQLSK